ncbi:Glutamate synthase domain-containing protein 2 [Allopseudospirillum japonicum]|uniref:Glutamate synthase domain-containing protein 2 n=1 Tax=Allopseudospirillum japonicum TaxID=64971 RepID=A0A1H6QF26_9GAMM|nr:FMN-binding glutamate synthase family protein [Allopseudospirillum japonicum]SEI37815.1 Glutamate synthase domain-containing protein 2 [Allopseudospirillum japonicum]
MQPHTVLSELALNVLGFTQLVFFTGLIVAAVVLVVMYWVDKNQTKHAIRRNFPLLGRFRYFFEYLGEFFRQYFFAMDREEMPFNRAQRSWIYRAAKNLDNTVAFGSTRDLRVPGTILFLNSAYPILEQEAQVSPARQIGPYTRHPYDAPSIFNISGMSYGALSKPAVQALSRGAALAGCWMNTGEGGLSPYHLEGGCDIVFQIGTAKYGVRNHEGHLDAEKLTAMAAHPQVKMFELKLSQGAKPGKGGMLPGSKVSEEIALIRAIPVGEDSFSPNRHPDIQTSADLLDRIAFIREVTGKPCGIKFVMGDHQWLEDLFHEITTRGLESAPDFITLDSADGGTGAAPMPLIDAVGLTLKESLPLLVDMLIAHGLRERIRVIASGKLVNPTHVAWALAMGADFCVTARGFMFSLGCIQAFQCNKNTCPTGITTHDPELQQGLVASDKAERVAQYHRHLLHEVGMIAHSCGVVEPRGLTRNQVHLVQADGRSVNAAHLYANQYQGPQA